MGGHGGLNILPKKSWNVYNRKNRYKVKRDEERAAQLEKEQKEAQTRADWQYRREQLSKKTLSNEATAQHQNFFIEQEKALAQTSIKNAKDECEDKLHQKFRFAYGCEGKKPWYVAQNNERSQDRENNSLPSRIRREREEVEEHRRRKHKRRTQEDCGNMLKSGVLIEKDTSHIKKKKKSIEELRKERLQREKEERQRSINLINRKAERDGTRTLPRKRYYSSYGYGRS